MIKQIMVDENNVVLCCSVGGFIEGGIDVEDIPNEVMLCPQAWKYEGGGYIVNEGYEEPAVGIEDLKAAKVDESKEKLAEWLSENPMQYTDGKLYSVTTEKQSLLNSNLASYERAKAAGLSYPLKWNASGEECTEYSYEELVGLSLSIAAYVAPRVSQQQELEILINACESIEDLDKVVISYE